MSHSLLAQMYHKGKHMQLSIVYKLGKYFLSKFSFYKMNWDRQVTDFMYWELFITSFPKAILTILILELHFF